MRPPGDAGVVDPDVHRAERVLDFSQRRVDRRAIAHVRAEGEPATRDVGGELPRLDVEVEHGQLGALLPEPDADRLPDPRRSTGYHRDLAIEMHV